MMARAVIRKPEIPCFVLNSQVRVADWEQVCGTHQGQQQIPTLRPKAGHRTVLTNRATNAFFSCKADAIHTGQNRLLHLRILLMQQLLAFAASLFWQCGTFHRTGRSKASIWPELRPHFRCCQSRPSRSGQSCILSQVNQCQITNPKLPFRWSPRINALSPNRTWAPARQAESRPPRRKLESNETAR
ncbi:hypothetical protein TRM7557_01485 [Tritonibacter multivorans]|uniref:Uncharacterized protein n=1 Tax=Tritonibacter multivorans TaxID=928856 RepID=A0A0P1G856_9RHOB|nr:hypothetical protein TRM7557_01485 [Tritonibacter multivorans]